MRNVSCYIIYKHVWYDNESAIYGEMCNQQVLNLQIFLLTRTFGGVAKELITAFATSSASSILKSAAVVTSLEYLRILANISVAVGPGLTL